MQRYSRLATRGLLAHDIAQAITELVGRTELPLAFTREQVVDQLLIIVETDDEGLRHKLENGIREAVREKFENRIINSSLFQAGYKHYEKDSENPVVPVTKYFFTSVYHSGTNAIDAMTNFDMQHSLPKRTSNARGRDLETGEEIANDAVIDSGPIAGIIIFPPNYGARRKDGENPALLQKWLERGVRVTEGANTHIANRLAYARPNTTSAATARDTAKTIGSGLRRALPKLPPPKAAAEPV